MLITEFLLFLKNGFGFRKYPEFSDLYDYIYDIYKYPTYYESILIKVLLLL